jgi:ferric-chelate reductase
VALNFRFQLRSSLGYYIWPALMVWGLDRFLRLIRIFFVNGGFSTLLNTKSSEPLAASIDVISPKFLRVTLRRPDHFRWAPGQLAYLSIPSISAMPWEAHPFTIASIDGDIPQAVIDSDASGDSENSSEKDTCVTVESVAATAETITPPGYSKKLVFLLRVHDGFTKRLLNAASNSTGGAKKTFGAFIDGPYCAPPSVRGFGTVLLFSGMFSIQSANFLIQLQVDPGSPSLFPCSWML